MKYIKVDESNDNNKGETTLTVHSDDVALPEVRTGKVDLEGDFEKDQSNQGKKKKQRLSFDTVAVPEYHTGKCEPQDANEEPSTDNAKKNGKKKRSFLGDLARTLMNGSSD